jgi:hypothetical protein
VGGTIMGPFGSLCGAKRLDKDESEGHPSRVFLGGQDDAIGRVANSGS